MSMIFICGLSILCELREVFFSLRRVMQLNLIALDQEILSQYERIHLCHDEALVGVFRCADDRFPTNIEARIDHHRAISLFVKSGQ